MPLAQIHLKIIFQKDRKILFFRKFRSHLLFLGATQSISVLARAVRFLAYVPIGLYSQAGGYSPGPSRWRRPEVIALKASLRRDNDILGLGERISERNSMPSMNAMAFMM